MNGINSLILAAAVYGIMFSYEHGNSIALAARNEFKAPSNQTGILLAKNEANEKKAKEDKKPAKGSRERFITREAQVKKRQRNIDFDAVDISGERKTPFGSIVDQNKSNKDFDLIKIRMRWHPEMIQSASSLETGRSK